MATPAHIARNAALPLVGFLNRARLGFPAHFFQGTGGIGDDLLCTAVFHELRRRGAAGIVFTTPYPALFERNPDVDSIVYHPRPRWSRWLREGLPFVPLRYADYDAESDRDEPLTEHIVARMCRQAGLAGAVDLRPYLHLSPAELAAGRLAENQVVMQSSGRAAAHFMRNKEWFPERFQEVCDHWSKSHTVIQIGSAQDPPLRGATDLRGRTSLRESAAILANSLVFVGLVGFLMHLARAVDCRGVIVYGGRERPQHSGYVANLNLVGDTACSPCWLRNRCEYDHECMRTISTDAVTQAIKDQLVKEGLPLEVETVTL